VFTGHFWKPYIEQAACSAWYLMDLIGEAEEHVTIQLETSMWLRKRGDEKILLRGM
jgi:hypothetical protein